MPPQPHSAAAGDVTAPVIIAGGGLVGLSAAMFLAQHGVRSLVIERLDSISPLPRAAFFHMRTLEMFRGAGIEQAVREMSNRDFVTEGEVIGMDCLSGSVQARFISNLNEGVEALSPCRRLFLNQPSLEPILQERAMAGGATLMRGFEIIRVEQDASGVTVTVRNIHDGAERTLRSEFLIAADGGHSRVRELLGIAVAGRPAFSSSVTIYFRADLSPWIADHAWSIIYIKNPVLSGFFRMNRTARQGFLAVNSVGDPQADPAAAANAAADVSEARLLQLVRAGVGVADLPVQLEGISRWRATTSVAEKFRERRVFIVGDAAHVMPPTGGFGGNTGIHDVHNLAWKLSLVLRGQAAPALLNTYESERKPVARFTVEQAFARYVIRTAPWLQGSHQFEPLVPDFDVELGYLYGSPDAVHAAPASSGGAPGSRAPHLWLRRGGQDVSTLDLTGDFLLLVGPEGRGWQDAAKAAADQFGNLKISVHQMGMDVEDPDGRFPQLYGVSSRGASLVRPDGFVAWRSSGASVDAARDLLEALKTSLGH